jgi:hypothetical protein
MVGSDLQLPAHSRLLAFSCRGVKLPDSRLPNHPYPDSALKPSARSANGDFIAFSSHASIPGTMSIDSREDVMCRNRK